MTENSDDPVMKMYQLEANLIKAQVMFFEKTAELDERNNELKKKNEEIETLQSIVEELRREIISVKEENEELKEKLNKEMNEKETEREVAKNEVTQLQKEVKTCKTQQIQSSKNIKGNIEEIRSDVAHIIQKLCQLEIEADVLTEESELQANLPRLAKKNAELEENKSTDLVNCSQTEEPNKDEGKNVKVVEEEASVLIMKSSNEIYLLDSGANYWKKLKISLPKPMLAFGAALVNGEIYIFGGKTDNNYCQSCYKLKSDGTWMEMASLNEKRSYISNSSVVYFEEIWVIGGSSGNKKLKLVEKYNISQNKWIQMPNLNRSRSSAAAAVYKNKIIVTGGSGANNSAELFDPELQKWILFFDLPIDVISHCMTISDSILTIYGGYSRELITADTLIDIKDDTTKNVWEMDIDDPQKKWTKKQDLKYPRSSFGIAKLSNGIMAIGGGNDRTTEIFDGKNWIEGPTLPQYLLCFAYVAIPRSVEKDLLTKCS